VQTDYISDNRCVWHRRHGSGLQHHSRLCHRCLTALHDMVMEAGACGLDRHMHAVAEWDELFLYLLRSTVLAITETCWARTFAA